VHVGDRLLPHARTMSTIMEDLQSLGSFASGGSFASRAAEPGSQADFGTPSKLSSLVGGSRGGGVGFDPGVEVVAFKPKWPAAELKNLGRTYECNLEGAVHVPQTWSFVSTSSLASTATSPGTPFTEPPIGMRRFPGEALSTVIEELTEPPPMRGCPSFGSAAAGQPATALESAQRADSFGTLLASAPSPPPPPPRHQWRLGGASLARQTSPPDSFGQLQNSPKPRADTFGTLLPAAPGPLPVKRLQYDAPQRPRLPPPPGQGLHRPLPPAPQPEPMDSFGIFGKLPAPRPCERAVA